MNKSNILRIAIAVIGAFLCVLALVIRARQNRNIETGPQSIATTAASTEDPIPSTPSPDTTTPSVPEESSGSVIESESATIPALPDDYANAMRILLESNWEDINGDVLLVWSDTEYTSTYTDIYTGEKQSISTPYTITNVFLNDYGKYIVEWDYQNEFGITKQTYGIITALVDPDQYELATHGIPYARLFYRPVDAVPAETISPETEPTEPATEPVETASQPSDNETLLSYLRGSWTGTTDSGTWEILLRDNSTYFISTGSAEETGTYTVISTGNSQFPYSVTFTPNGSSAYSVDFTFSGSLSKLGLILNGNYPQFTKK